MIFDPKGVHNSGIAKITAQTGKTIDSEKIIETTGKITAQTGIKAEGIKKIKTDNHHVKTGEMTGEPRAAAKKDSLTNQEIISFRIDKEETIRIDRRDSTKKTTAESKKEGTKEKIISNLRKRKRTTLQNEAQAGAIRGQSHDRAQKIANPRHQKLRQNHH